MTSYFWVRRIGLSFVSGLFGAAVVAGAVLAPNEASALPTPTDCIADRDGANFEAAKTDLTLFCANTGDGSPFELSTIINYDWINAPSNGSDSCVLFDTDNDAFANLAVCVTLDSVNNVTVIAAIRLFTCNDSKADRCAGNTLVTGPYTTECEVSQQNTDPFPGPAPGPGEAYPADTEVLCGIDLDDFNGAASSAVLQDACSYSSSNPNANPQDCISFEVCTTNADCNDNNDCTTDTCDATNVCNFAPATGQPCTDDLYCNGEETCTDQGLCGVGTGTPVDCSDNVDCTIDTCDELTDSCDSEPMNSLCSDDLFCTGVETCDELLGCQDGANPTCNDFVDCTTDSCNEATDDCDFIPDNGECADSAFCNGSEVCTPGVGCEAGTPQDCDDAVACTVDNCDEGTDACTHTPSNNACDDEVYCNGAETCDGSAGCVAGTPIDCADNNDCTDDSCNEASESCINDENDAHCDDDLFCNGAETCGSAGCEAGTPVSCNDGVSCTSDSCNEDTNQCDNTPDNTPCGDNNDCNGIEVCDPVQGCQAGQVTDCDDGIECTIDTCDTNGDCVHTPNNAICDDGNFCTGEDTCIAGVGCAVGTVPDCDDGIECTTDECNETFDSCTHTSDDTKCSDGAFCNGSETCDTEEGCEPGTPPNCNDGVGCTVDTCNEANDVCDHAADDADCDDAVFCNGAETCNTNTDCQPGTPPTCNDNVDCTIDACDVTSDACTNTTNDASCDDDLYCNGEETCDATEGCQEGTAPNCNDNVDCTDDSCVEATDSCANVPDNASCSDGEFCTGVEICNPSTGCGEGANPCPDLNCDEDEDLCFGCATNAECDDSVFCNGAETCVAGDCTPGTPIDCNDNVDCTIDSCDEDADTCDHPTSDAFCSDNLYCNGVETCDAEADCQAGTPVDCDDLVDCTTDSCDEATDTCLHPTSDDYCDNDTFCDGDEICDPIQGCLDQPDPNCNDNVDCTTDSCDNQTEACLHDPNNAECDDETFCNGVETCDVLAGCQAGTPPSCNDNVDCTQDLCDTNADACSNTPSNAFCDDTLFCNGAETCAGSAGCVSGTPVACSDNVDCTDDGCNEDTDECDYTANDENCDDGLFCTGKETCDAQLGCQVPSNVDCNDNVDCTDDSCNEASDECDNIPDNTDCSDDEFCNGDETCDPLLGCQAGTDPDCDDGVECTTDECNEEGESCSHTPHDSLCDDALFCNGAETCGEGGCVAATNVDCNDNVDCTNDSCNEGTDQCDHVADNAECDDGLFCNGTETCNVMTGCAAGNNVNCSDAFICSTDSCNEATDLCEHNMNTCVCGDMEQTGSEECDPPAMAGTYEDCNDDLDNDADGKIDCRDPDCKPGARDPLCDEACTMDQVCLKFIRDPARITFSRDGGPDEVYIHGRIPMEGDRLRASVHAITFELSNATTPIYRAILDPGDMRGGVAGKRFRFTDRDARTLGQLSARNGLERVWVRTRKFEGVRYLVFTVRAWGDFSKARHRLMTTELSVGPEVGFLTQEWNATPRGWILHQKNFDD